ncbi:hypothetical protein LIER_17049 [Lithospermum erythrorhizon]|uniref:Uncharacterized protein n=1 Tax=Lithospermum erythrorhizon TaxID=34254 RepID=A0AAV3QAA1_LITER
MEHHVVRRMRTIFEHDLESFKWNLSRDLREEMKLKPPQDGPPPVFELDGDKLQLVASDHHVISMDADDGPKDHPKES